MFKIMIFDSDRTFAVMLKKDLEMRGFDAVAYFTGNGAIDLIINELPDVLLLGCNLTGVSPTKIAHKIRKFGFAMPIIFFSENNDIKEVSACYESGGSDYIRKPVFLEELLARIKVQLSGVMLKCMQDVENQYITVNNNVFDFVENTISECGRLCKMTKTQAAIVRYLLAKKDQVVSFETIASECLCSGELTPYSMNSMKVIMCNLRKDFEKNEITGVRIETYRKKGMSLCISNN